MRSSVRTFIVTGCTILAAVCTIARVSEAQQPQSTIGSYYPSQLIPGQTTVLHVATDARTKVQSIVDKNGNGIRYQAIYSNEFHGLRIDPPPPLAGGQGGAPPSPPAAPGR